MTRSIALLVGLLVCLQAPVAQAEDARLTSQLTDPKRWSIGLGLGNFDSDTSDSDDPHLNEAAYTLVLGYQPWRSFAIGAELLQCETARVTDEFNELTAFGGRCATLSA